MPTLNNKQKRDIIDKEKTTSATGILSYILRYDNLSLDDFPQMDPSKREWIVREMQKRPNPNEVGEWQTIQQLIVPDYTKITIETLSQLHNMLEQYLRRWAPIPPNGNHVNAAQTEYDKVQKELNNRMQQSSQDEWPNLDKGDKQALTNFVRKYPITNHKDEIDDDLWNLTDRERKQDLYDYISLFSNGKHTNDAQAILNDILDWEQTTQSDIYSVQNYIDNHSNSQYINVPQGKLDELKQAEIRKMRNLGGNYSVTNLLNLIDGNIFSIGELTDEKIVTKQIVDNMRLSNPSQGLNIVGVISNSTPRCRDGYTDVYFFGIPSTGKTCVLMGLISSQSLDINWTSAGGNYAQQLDLYAKRAMVVDATPGTFTTSIEALMYAPDDSSISYGVNLVEMSGEEFASKIAQNPDDAISFKHMGGDVATSLLQNNNRKVFFLIIDPTSERQDVNIRGQLVTVSQNILLQKMINLFQSDENKEIMQRVDSLHFIMTKADTLPGSVDDRGDEAKKLFNSFFNESTLISINKLCKKYNININSDFWPRLYTFSLGTFTIGNYFIYDSTDAQLLAAAIRNSAQRTKEKSLWDEFIEKVN